MYRVALLAAAASLSLGSAALAATTFTDGFEGDATGAPVASLDNFDITLGSVDVVGAGNPYNIYTLSNVVDLDGAGSGEITSKDTFHFGAGQFVDLSFVLGGAQRGSLSDNFYTRLLFTSPVAVSGLGGTGVFTGVGCAPCTLGTNFTASGVVLGAQPFESSSLYFFSQQAGAFKFAFGTTSNDSVGPLLDSVSLSGAAVPEPASWALMIAGFGVTGAMLRRRRAAHLAALIGQGTQDRGAPAPPPGLLAARGVA